MISQLNRKIEPLCEFVKTEPKLAAMIVPILYVRMAVGLDSRYLAQELGSEVERHLDSYSDLQAGTWLDLLEKLHRIWILAPETGRKWSTSPMAWESSFWVPMKGETGIRLAEFALRVGRPALAIQILEEHMRRCRSQTEIRHCHKVLARAYGKLGEPDCLHGLLDDSISLDHRMMRAEQEADWGMLLLWQDLAARRDTGAGPSSTAKYPPLLSRTLNALGASWTARQLHGQCDNGTVYATAHRLASWENQDDEQEPTDILAERALDALSVGSLSRAREEATQGIKRVLRTLCRQEACSLTVAQELQTDLLALQVV